MKINKFEINNYRSCIHTKLELHENLTALIGINGVGKSNILYGFQLFNKMKDSRRFLYAKPKEGLFHSQINLNITHEDRNIGVRANFFYETDERNFDDVIYTEVKYKFDTDPPRKWTKIKPDIFELVEFLKRQPSSTQLPRQFNTEANKFAIGLIKALSNLSYYSATQFSDPSKSPISIELDDYRISSRSKMSNSNVHQKFIYDLYRVKNSPKQTYNLFINTVGINGLGIIDDIDFGVHKVPSSSYKVITGGKIEKIENVKQIIIPSVIIDGLTLSPNQLSEGTFKTLALVFYILNDNSDLLLIEEPEISVHHGLLNSILELIKQQSKNKQIIISTHSDYVLDMLEPSNILLVNKKYGEGTKAQLLTKSLSKNEFEVLRKYLQTSGNLGEYWKEGGFDNE